MSATRRPAVPHPVARLGATIARIPKYLVLARSLLADPGLSRARKIALVAGIAYLVSPIDLVPGIIPVAGQLDDLAAVLLATRIALAGLPPDKANAHLAEAGLSVVAIAGDIANVRAATAWTARTTVTAARRVASAAVRTGVAVVRAGLRPDGPIRRRPGGGAKGSVADRS